MAGFVHSPLLPTAVRNTENDNLFHVTDWFPTISNLAGVSTNGSETPLDGFDIWPALTTGGARSVPIPALPKPVPSNSGMGFCGGGVLYGAAGLEWLCGRGCTLHLLLSQPVGNACLRP